MQSARVWNSVLRTTITTTTRRNYGGGKNLKLTSLNDMPVPEGDFYAHHAKRQRGHNMVLGIGIASLSFAIYLMKSTGLVNFHYSPPKTYE